MSSFRCRGESSNHRGSHTPETPPKQLPPTERLQGVSHASAHQSLSARSPHSGAGSRADRFRARQYEPAASALLALRPSPREIPDHATLAAHRADGIAAGVIVVRPAGTRARSGRLPVDWSASRPRHAPARRLSRWPAPAQCRPCRDCAIAPRGRTARRLVRDRRR
jgi:hypothetical protein